MKMLYPNPTGMKIIKKIFNLNSGRTGHVVFFFCFFFVVLLLILSRDTRKGTLMFAVSGP